MKGKFTHLNESELLVVCGGINTDDLILSMANGLFGSLFMSAAAFGSLAVSIIALRYKYRNINSGRDNTAANLNLPQAPDPGVNYQTSHEVTYM